MGGRAAGLVGGWGCSESSCAQPPHSLSPTALHCDAQPSDPWPLACGAQPRRPVRRRPCTLARRVPRGPRRCCRCTRAWCGHRGQAKRAPSRRLTHSALELPLTQLPSPAPPCGRAKRLPSASQRKLATSRLPWRCWTGAPSSSRGRRGCVLHARCGAWCGVRRLSPSLMTGAVRAAPLCCGDGQPRDGPRAARVGRGRQCGGHRACVWVQRVVWLRAL